MPPCIQRRYRVEPGSNARITTVYDAESRLIRLINPQGLRTTSGYDAADRKTVQKLANGSRTSTTYDAASRVARIVHLKSSNPGAPGFAYQYDNAGNRRGVLEANGDRVTWSFDPAYQLKREQRSGASSYDVTHTYDGAGNRTLKTDSGVRTTAVYDAGNRLRYRADGSGRTTFAFDASGNQVKQKNPAGQITTSVWNYENRNTVVRLPAGTRVTLTYNGDQVRFQKQTSGGTRKYVYDGQNLLVETDGSNVAQAVYTLEPLLYGNLVSQRQLVGAAWSDIYYHFDALGSTDRLSDASQVVSDSYTYFGFGELKTSSGTTTNLFTWVGQVGYIRDTETGEYNLRARQYLPDAARFKSEDPLGTEWSENLYSYVDNDPINSFDPSGNFKTTEECEAQKRRMQESQEFLRIELNQTLSDINKLDAAKNEVESRIAEINQRKEDARKNVNRVQSNLTKATNYSDRLTAERSGVVDSLQRIKNQEVALRRQHRDWKRELQRRAAAAIRHRGNWNLRTSVDEARRKLSEVDANLRELRRFRAEYDEKRKLYNEELKTSAAEIAALRSALEAAKNQLRAIESETAEELNSLNATAKQLQKSRDNLAKMRSKDESTHRALANDLRNLDCSRPAQDKNCDACPARTQPCSREIEIPPSFFEWWNSKINSAIDSVLSLDRKDYKFIPDRLRIDYPCNDPDAGDLAALMANRGMVLKGLGQIQGDVAIGAQIAKQATLAALPGGEALSTFELVLDTAKEGVDREKCLQAGVIFLRLTVKVVRTNADGAGGTGSPTPSGKKSTRPAKGASGKSPDPPKSGLGSATRLSADELATGQRLEAQLRKSLRESPHVGAEYVDDLGRTFDALGTPNASKFWNQRQFLASIDSHLLKSNNFTVIDLTGFTAAQIATVESHLATLTMAQLAKIIKIGF